jgi:hypothetical protein
VKDNSLQEASTLSAFVGVNIVSVHEVAVALNAAKSKVAEMEKTLETIKEVMASEQKKEIQQTNQMHEEEMDRWLQAQEKYLQDKFSESTSLTQKAHASEMQKLKTSQD